MKIFESIIDWLTAWFAKIPRLIVRLAIKHYYGIESTPVEYSTVDLEEEVNRSIQEKLNGIRERIYDSREKIYVRSNAFYDVVIPVSEESCITFKDKEEIHLTPNSVFEGEFLKQKSVAIKKVGDNDKQLDKEMEIAKLLEHHENFLVHFFGFNQLKENYIVTELYTTTLYMFLQDSLTIAQRVNIRNMFKQLCNGVEFMHASRIAHRHLNTMNISIFMRVDGETRFGQPICKIMNFHDAITEPSEDDLKRDVGDLAEVLLSLRDFKQKKLKYLEQKSNELSEIHQYFNYFIHFEWNPHDDNLCIDLAYKMTASVIKTRLSIKECRTHPFLWSSTEALRCIVDSAKLLEPVNGKTFGKLLNKVARKVVGKDWRCRISKDIRFELDDINRAQHFLGQRSGSNDITLNSNIIGLVKIIRNLVKYFNKTIKKFIKIF